jgi:hypothetical protein
VPFQHQDQYEYGEESHVSEHVQFLAQVGRIDGIEITAEQYGGKDREEGQIGEDGQDSRPTTGQHDEPQAYSERERGHAGEVIPVKFDCAAAANQVWQDHCG